MGLLGEPKILDFMELRTMDFRVFKLMGFKAIMAFEVLKTLKLAIFPSLVLRISAQLDSYLLILLFK